MKSKSLLILLLLYSYLLFFQIHPSLVNPDGIGYYAYVRSLFLDRDLNFLNEFKALDILPPFVYRTSTGLVGNQYPIGSSILWAPFFLIGHLYTRLSPYLYPSSPNADGYSVFYFIFIAVGTSFYGILGLFLVYEIGKHLFSPKAVLSAILLITFGTPFFYYLVIQPTLAHINSFFTLSLFLYIWFFTRNQRTLGQWMLLGLLAGLMGLVRTQNLLFILLPVLELAVYSPALPSLCLQVTVFLSSLLFALVPQMLAWKILYGTLFSPIHGTMNVSFQDWHLWELLFSSFHGLFFYSPLLLSTLPGFYLLTKRDFLLGTASGAFLLLQTFLNSWALYWWGGYAFGSRFFVDYTFLFVLSLAGVIHQLEGKSNRPILADKELQTESSRQRPMGYLLATTYCLLILLGLWNFLLLIQTLLQRQDLNHYIPLPVLLQGQLWALKNFIPSLIQILFLPKLRGYVLLRLAPVFLMVTFILGTIGWLLRRVYQHPPMAQGEQRTRVINIFLICYLLSFIIVLSFASVNPNLPTSKTEISETVEDFKAFLRLQSKTIYEEYLRNR
ncbi:MAG TPA: glycosyltransferase family 39 protein [Candidatus Limnocylindrales bacterium]|nr:glycosyltransferase family 39 protein [Candidatus Limnocylindrales bacterium]